MRDPAAVLRVVEGLYFYKTFLVFIIIIPRAVVGLARRRLGLTSNAIAVCKVVRGNLINKIAIIVGTLVPVVYVVLTPFC